MNWEMISLLYVLSVALSALMILFACSFIEEIQYFKKMVSVLLFISLVPMENLIWSTAFLLVILMQYSRIMKPVVRWIGQLYKKVKRSGKK